MESQVSNPEAIVDGAWRSVVVHLKVPHDAQHLSFGCYSKIDLIRVRNVQLRTVDETVLTSTKAKHSQDASAEIQYSILVAPGQVTGKQPSNLGFTEVLAEPLQQASKSQADLR